MLVYVIIRNSEDAGMDNPEVFEDYDLARKRFTEIIDEEKEYINYDEDCYADIEEDDNDNFVYTDDDGRHEARFYLVNTAK